MADEVGFDAFDSIQIPETMTSDAAPAMDAALAEGAPESAPTDAAAPDLRAVPDPEGEPDGGHPAAPEWQADGSLRLPDGRVMTQAEIAAQFAAPPTEAAPVAPKADPVMERIEAIQKMVEEIRAPKEPPPAPEPDLINPVTEPQDWVRGYLAQENYTRQARGQEPLTWQDGLEILRTAQAQENARQLQRLHERFDAQERERNQQAEALKIQQEVQKIEASGKYDNLKGERGQQLLNYFVKGLKPGENLESAYKGASEFLSAYVMEQYAKPKQDKAAQVLRGMPRGGGARPTPKPSYGGGFDAFEKMEQDLLKGVR